jgi:hypothetical protein
MRLKSIIMAAVHGIERGSREWREFFAWQNVRDYRQCRLIKAASLWQQATFQKRGTRGTAPHDDPV